MKEAKSLTEGELRTIYCMLTCVMEGDYFCEEHCISEECPDNCPIEMMKKRLRELL